jgi:hypothetical protein
LGVGCKRPSPNREAIVSVKQMSRSGEICSGFLVGCDTVITMKNEKKFLPFEIVETGCGCLSAVALMAFLLSSLGLREVKNRVERSISKSQK